MANPGLIQKETQKENLHPPKRVKENLLRTGARRVIKAKASKRHSSCCTRCEDFHVTSEVTTLYVHRIAMLCPRGVYLNTSHNAHNSVVALSFPFLTDALIRKESQPNPTFGRQSRNAHPKLRATKLHHLPNPAANLALAVTSALSSRLAAACPLERNIPSARDGLLSFQG